MPDGTEHPAKGVYREITAPQRLVFTIDHSELSDQWHDVVNPDRISWTAQNCVLVRVAPASSRGATAPGAAGASRR